MATPENDLVPSIRMSGGSFGSTPEMMNVSPLTDGTPRLPYQEQSQDELLKKRERLYAQRNKLQAQLHIHTSSGYIYSRCEKYMYSVYKKEKSYKNIMFIFTC